MCRNWQNGEECRKDNKYRFRFKHVGAKGVNSPAEKEGGGGDAAAPSQQQQKAHKDKKKSVVEDKKYLGAAGSAGSTRCRHDYNV